MVVAVVLAVPAPAQTLDDAVRGNATLALSLCLSTIPDQATLNAAFTAAGFAYAPEDFGGGNVNHWFLAPADTVAVMVRGEGREGFCAISTNHMGVTAAISFAGEALNTLYPGLFAYGEIENTPPVTPGSPGAQDGDCTGYLAWAEDRPITISLANAGNGPSCTEDGTSQIVVYMTHPLRAPGQPAPAPTPEPAPAQAQGFGDAVRANLAVATTLCLQAMIDRVPAATAFGNAGFTYRGVDRGVNEYGIALGIDHYFDAPAETARAEVDDASGITGLCHVYSTHLQEAELAGIAANAIFARFPGAQMRGANEWSIATPSGLPLIVSTTTIGTNHRYEAPGTVRVSMSYPG